LDRNDRQFKDRDLFLDTATLPIAKRAAVELVAESQRSGNERELLKIRSLFLEESGADWGEDRLKGNGEMKSFFLHSYFEDEKGNEIRMYEMGPILTGDPNMVLFPSGSKRHDIDYTFAEKTPVPVAEITLTTEDTRRLGYFVRDFEELRDSALMKDGPGSIKTGGSLLSLLNDDYHLATAVTDDEIRSFMTIFRRLYMKNEPANFLKSVDLFENALGGHPLGRWVKGFASEYEKHLQEVPDFLGRRNDMNVSFKVKRLIDVFLYTQYAHQPDEQRQRQYLDCLQQVGGRRNFLTWLFLKEVWKCSLEMVNAGQVIDEWFKTYCDHHGIKPDVLNSLRAELTGLGTEEKREARKARLFREKLEELELELWKKAGKPEGGPIQYRMIAQQQLKHALIGKEGD
jgi:hypothetical protein